MQRPDPPAKSLPKPQSKVSVSLPPELSPQLPSRVPKNSASIPSAMLNCAVENTAVENFAIKNPAINNPALENAAPMATAAAADSNPDPATPKAAAAELAAYPRTSAGQTLDLEWARLQLEPLAAAERLRWAWEQFGPGLALTTSFGIQSAVLLHMVSQVDNALGSPGIPVIWVDTGYMPPETYHYAETLRQRLPLRLVVAQAELSPARMEALHGRLWETGRLEDFQLYNRLRKVEPLDQAFQSLGVTCWASGVRGRQTDHRRTMQPIDPVRGAWSLRPLLNWTSKDVYYYMQEHDLPQHPLFEQGYSTVGDWHSSAPDDGTTSGRDTRFQGLKQECGIHLPGMLGDGI
jgi:phosphoadenosine phosphosulfate reductase